jgi:transposase
LLGVRTKLATQRRTTRRSPEEKSMNDLCVPGQYRARVEQRMAVVEFASVHGIKPAGRHFGLARRTVRTWLRRWKVSGLMGLVPQYPRQRKRRLPATTIELIRIARFEYRWGAPRTRLWLEREHALKVNPRTIQRVFRDLGMPLLRASDRASAPIAAGEQAGHDEAALAIAAAF